MNNYKTLSTETIDGTRITLLEFASGKDLEISENHFILKTVKRHKPSVQEFEDRELAKTAYLNAYAELVGESISVFEQSEAYKQLVKSFK